MKLIITEKNQTAKRIAQVLSDGKARREGGPRSTLYAFKLDGEDVKCLGLRGHIMKVDFPPEFRQWQDVEPRELVDAEILKVPSEKTLVSAVKKLAKSADKIVIATDYDREGELIGADVASLIRDVNPRAEIKRARFSSLTPTEIKKAFSSLEEIDEGLARAGEARQDIDLIWGAALTRFISLATTRLGQRFLSVGRVQSPTLALVVQRENEIQSFIPEDYWQVKARLKSDGEEFVATHKTERFDSQEKAKRAYEKVKGKGVIVSAQVRKRKIAPPSPFNTTAFIAAASALRVSPARAMELAENLYSRGYISYPRVDNTVYPSTLSIRSVLKSISSADVVGELALELLGKDSYKPTRGKTTATDHPPIYPTDSARKEELTPTEWKIYELVVRRFLATISDPAEAESMRLDIDINGEPFVAKGDVIKEEGFLRYYPYFRKKDEELPALKEGDEVRVLEGIIEKKQTQPPPRYTEGKLIEKMEEEGLGTKSTRHIIVQNLIERGYIYGSPLRPSETGIAVASALERHATHVTTPEMTARLEMDMDAIVERERTLEGVIEESRVMLKEILEGMEEKKSQISQEIRNGIRGDMVLGVCPSCGGEIRIRKAKKTGKRFAGCGNYPECETLYPLPQSGGVLATGEICEQCGTPKVRIINKGRKPWELCLDPNCPRKNRYEAGKASRKKSGKN